MAFITQINIWPVICTEHWLQLKSRGTKQPVTTPAACWLVYLAGYQTTMLLNIKSCQVLRPEISPIFFSSFDLATSDGTCAAARVQTFAGLCLFNQQWAFFFYFSEWGILKASFESITLILALKSVPFSIWIMNMLVIQPHVMSFNQCGNCFTSSFI